MPPSAPPSLSPAELSYLHTSLSSHPPIRADSRSATDFRPLSAETGILPLTNGSAHVSFSDGSEAIVGIKAEVEKSTPAPNTTPNAQNNDAMQVDSPPQQQRTGSPSWISLSLNLPSTRDDDSTLLHLESTLLEPLQLSSLPSKLTINTRFHWHLNIDLLLISPHGLTSYPLPLLSIAIHLALRSTRIPLLKSTGEEDPMADDDWEASVYLYPNDPPTDPIGEIYPPITLLLTTNSNNIIFDPTYSELKVADSILAISIIPITTSKPSNDTYKVQSIRTINPPSRDTFSGEPINNSSQADDTGAVPGVWRPKVGGVKRSVLKEAIKTVLGSENRHGVAKEVFDGLEGFLRVERG